MMNLAVGVDVGNNSTKTVGVNAQGIKESVINTFLTRGRVPVDSFLAKSTYREWAVEHNTYTVGWSNSHEVVLTGTANWWDGLARVAMIHDAVHTVSSGAPVVLVATIPLHDYYNADGSKNTANIAAHESRLKLNAVRIDGKKNNLISIKILPEGLCAGLDHIMDNQGVVQLKDKKILVIDIGGGTTDVLPIFKLDPIIKNSLSAPLGINVALKAFKKAFPNTDEETLRNGFLTGVIKVCGEKQDVTALRNQLLADLAARITTLVQNNVDDIGTYDNVVLVGGGAIALQPYLTKESLFPRQRMSDKFIFTPLSPQCANARGAFKFASYLAGKA